MTTSPAKSNEPTQDAIDTVSLHLIRLAKKEKDDKQGKLRTAYKTGDLRGLNTDAAKEAIKLVKDGDEAIETFFNNFQKTARYVGLLGKILKPAQYDLFDKQGPHPEDERAKIEGRSAGLDMDPEMSEQKMPYEAGSLKGQAWLAAFRQARSERDAILSMAVPEKKEEDGEGDGA